jgi:hypothetical protein
MNMQGAPIAPAALESALEAAISRLTLALTTASDAALPGIVSERKAMREELADLRARRDSNVLPFKRS